MPMSPQFALPRAPRRSGFKPSDKRARASAKRGEDGDDGRDGGVDHHCTSDDEDCNGQARKDGGAHVQSPGAHKDDGRNQLRNTTAQSLHKHALARAICGQCVCCCRPVLRQDHATRHMRLRGVFAKLHEDPAADRACPIFREQGASGGETLVCYICEPMCKRAPRKFEASATITHPSVFLTQSLGYLRGTVPVVDKLSLVKAMALTKDPCMGDVAVGAGGAELLFHPVRSKHFEVLEGVVAFLFAIFAAYNCNVHDFSRDSALCPFLVGSAVQWHARGCAFAFDDMKTSARMRRLFKGPLNAIYGRVFRGDTAFDVATLFRARQPAADPACAACMRERVARADALYEVPLLTAPAVLSAGIRHWAPDTRGEGAGAAWLHCRGGGGCAPRSFAYYQQLSAAFPRAFHEENPQRYFHDLLAR